MESSESLNLKWIHFNRMRIMRESEILDHLIRTNKSIYVKKSQ